MRYDIIIVGSGPGGYVAAIRAAQLGKKTALVERAEPGGVCLNWGCIPTKALLKSAQVYGYCKNAEHYGLELAGEVRPNLEAIVARSRSVAETMSKGVQFLLRKNQIDRIYPIGRIFRYSVGVMPAASRNAEENLFGFSYPTRWAISATVQSVSSSSFCASCSRYSF